MWLNFYVLTVYVSMANCSFYVSVEPTFLPELVRYCLCVGSALLNAAGEFPFLLQIMHMHKLVLFFLQIFMNADVHIYLFILYHNAEFQQSWHCRSSVRFTRTSHSVSILSLTSISSYLLFTFTTLMTHIAFVHSLGIEPITFSLLAPCSTA